MGKGEEYKGDGKCLIVMGWDEKDRGDREADCDGARGKERKRSGKDAARCDGESW